MDYGYLTLGPTISNQWQAPLGVLPPQVRTVLLTAKAKSRLTGSYRPQIATFGLDKTQLLLVQVLPLLIDKIYHEDVIKPVWRDWATVLAAYQIQAILCPIPGGLHSSGMNPALKLR